VTTAANVQATTVDLDLYVAAGIGSDLNPGTSPAQALATYAAALRLIPFEIKHRVIVHMATGTYQVTQTIGPKAHDLPIFVYGDGAGQVGDDGFIVLASGAAQAGSGVGVLVTTGGFTVNQHRGKTIQITSGAASGDRRTVRSNTATDFIPAANFSAAVAAGDTYRIVEPSVVLEFELVSATTVTASEIVPIARNCTGGTVVDTMIQTVQTGVPVGPVFANLRMKTRTGDADVLGAVSILGSDVGFYGVELVADATKALRLSADRGSSLYAGYDFLSSNVLPTALRPLEAGLATGRQSWVGWGVSGMATGTISYRALRSFRGYVAFAHSVVIDDCSWQLLGGSIIVTLSSALQAELNSYVFCGNTGSLPTLLIRCETDVADTSAILVFGSSSVELTSTVVEKQNQGHCLAAVASGSGLGAIEGHLGINSSVTLTGITAVTAPTNAIKCLGGRVDMRTTTLVISGFATGTQLAVYQGAGAGILVQQTDLADLIAGSALPCVPDRIFFLANGLLTGFVDGVAGTFTAAAMVDGLREISRFSLIDTVRMTQVIDGTAGTTTMELFRRRAAVNTSLGTVSLASGGGAFASATFTPASVALRTLLIGDILVAQFNARQTGTAANVTIEILGAGIDGRFGWIRRL
jgi:hypothetical protein